MEFLNNREVSILVWASVFIIWCLTQPDLRSSLLHLVKCFFVKPIIVAVLMMGLYITTLVWLMYQGGIWDTTQLKTTLLWCVSVSLISLFRIHKKEAHKDFFRNSIKDIFKLTLFLEFIVDFYTFGLIFELIFIPLMTVASVLLAISGTDKKYESVEKVLNKAFSLIGFFLISYAAYRAYYDISNMLSLNTIRGFLTPPLLSLGFMPFVFAGMVYVRYEYAIIRLKYLIKDSDLRSYAAKTALKKFHVNIELLERWLDSLVFLQINTKQDIGQSIQDLELTIRREKNPQQVPITEGWSPYEAKKFLEEVGLVLGHYHSVGDDEWHASSSYLEIGEDVLPDNIAFYIGGNATAVKSLKLILNVNYINTEKESLNVFLNAAMLLYNKALDKEMPINIKKAVLSGRQKKVKIKGTAISVTKHSWSMKINGYDMKFLIEL